MEVCRRWDVAALETAAITPKGASAAVVVWQDPTWVDAGPSKALASLTGRVLVSFGEVAFRSTRPPPTGFRELPGRQIRLWGRRDPWRIIATRVPEAAALLFEEGWSGGDQIGLVGASDDRCAEVLFSTDLSGLTLTRGEVLVGAIVDGAGALLATATAKRLEQVLDRWTLELRGAGITVDL